MKYCCNEFKGAVEGYTFPDGNTKPACVFRADVGPWGDGPVKDDEGKYVGLMQIQKPGIMVTNDGYEFHDDGLALIYFRHCPQCGTQLTDYFD